MHARNGGEVEAHRCTESRGHRVQVRESFVRRLQPMRYRRIGMAVSPANRQMVPKRTDGSDGRRTGQPEQVQEPLSEGALKRRAELDELLRARSIRCFAPKRTLQNS